MKTNYDDAPSFLLDLPASKLFELLEQVIQGAEQGKITVLTARGETPADPDYYRLLKTSLLEMLAPTADQTVARYRQALRAKRLTTSEKRSKDYMSHYSERLDRFLTLAPHYEKQLHRKPRVTRWTHNTDGTDDLTSTVLNNTSLQMFYRRPRSDS